MIAQSEYWSRVDYLADMAVKNGKKEFDDDFEGKEYDDLHGSIGYESYLLCCDHHWLDYQSRDILSHTESIGVELTDSGALPPTPREAAAAAFHIDVKNAAEDKVENITRDQANERSMFVDVIEGMQRLVSDHQKPAKGVRTARIGLIYKKQFYMVDWLKYFDDTFGGYRVDLTDRILTTSNKDGSTTLLDVRFYCCDSDDSVTGLLRAEFTYAATSSKVEIEADYDFITDGLSARCRRFPYLRFGGCTIPKDVVYKYIEHRYDDGEGYFDHLLTEEFE